MNPLPPVVCMSPADWKTPWWIDRHYLMLGLASRGWPVLYSSGPLSYWELDKQHRHGAPMFGRVEEWKSQEGVGILLDRPGWAFPSWPRSRWYNDAVLKAHARRLRGCFSDDALERGIAFLCAPQYERYGRFLGLPHTIYHIHDAYWMRGNWNEATQAAHEALAQEADWIFALSDTMLRNLPETGSRKSSVLPQAVYAEEYIRKATSPCPTDLQEIPRPRIGYMGRVSRKVNLDLVGAIARERPEWHWVFVGEVGVGFEAGARDHASLSAAADLPNVHFLGARSQSEMPVYMAHMDVNTMCYHATGGQWEAGNPLKMFEYLAVGKPVIGAGLENIRRYSHVVEVPESKEEWIAAIERALDRGGIATVDERRAVALDNTWDKVVDQLESKLLDLVGR